MAPGQVVPVRVQVEEGPSQALRAQLGGGPAVMVAAAPRAGVVAEALPPPPGITQSRRGRGTEPVQAAATTPDTPDVSVPDRLPEVVQRVPVPPVRLLVRAGSFGRAEYAARLQARLAGLGARIERVREGRSERFDVVAGPFAGVADADEALDRAVRAGVTDARIVVE